MNSLCLFASMLARLWASDLWYALPIIVAVSLVYAATRNEELSAILQHALRLGLMIVGFMAVIFLALWIFSRGL